ncbi:tetratricopeptide repeat protein [Edaphobacter modestus]|uniref:Tetratricopeptide repeat protein n=1 Tax=Edaphobacter modestus TaxID=388466 RepID=A0A4Q7Z0B5_9BACT|nr:tetratricopeptide repeat protein [Edaphobacter modestus]RZU43538.1 tetratricopeptide repeat protein [Edaphobacter modestus]
MHEANHNPEERNRSRLIRRTTLATIFCMASIVYAQLPAGTRDASSQAEAHQDPLRAQAADALAKQDYATAVKLLSTLAEKNPRDAQVLYNLGSAQDALDQTSDAEATYRRAIAAGPNLLEPHLALGLLLARAGKVSDAHAELAAAAAIPNGDPALRARAYRAMARLDQPSNPAGASDELLAALKLSPETADDVLLTGELAEANNDAASAEAAYRRILAADPDNLQAIAALSHLLLQQRKPDQAEPLLTAALQKHPDDPILSSQLAGLYESQNKADKALPIVERLHASQPQDAAISRLLARLYVRDRQFEKALPLYASLSAASPNDPTLLDDQADTLIRMRRSADAEPLLQRAVANPKAFPTPEAFGAAASHLAFAATNNNDPATVLHALQLRATVLPPSPSTIFLAATAHDKLHQVKEASDLYKQFLAVAKGQFPDEEWEARHRLLALEHMK